MTDFYAAIEAERAKNLLSEYYKKSFPPRLTNKDLILSPVQSALKSYKHEDALRFAAASLAFWKNGGDSHETNIRAYYRVVDDNRGKYVLEACHVNVHGTHRGDLRFIEVGKATRRNPGFKKLFLGDVVTVTKLTRLKKFEVFAVSKSFHDQPCVWMASSITVLPRKILEDVEFSLLDNGNAVVKEQTEVMHVITEIRDRGEVGQMYQGTCFVPEKLKYNFTADHASGLENRIIRACSKMHPSKNPFGTIFKSQKAPELSEMFHVGWDACKPGHAFKPPDVIELCALMGYSAAVSISNGRNDSRSFPMRHIERKGDFVEFFIENPEENPTDGKWMIKTKIEVRGDGERSNATIESVIPHGPKGIKIVARLSRDVKRGLKFTKGVHVVCQQEGIELEGLRKGFFEKFPRGSNGHRILEALYGGQKITYEVPKTPDQCWFNGVQERIQLNVFQCAYVHMLMARIPMVVGSSPFGCGKSMTIVTAAQDIYQRNPRKKQLLITQSNYASVNLVDIASKLDSISRFKFVRYLSERNYLEFPEECLTEHDMQNLMKTVFSSWAKGEIITSRQLEPKDLKRMLNFVLCQKLVEPGNLSGQALKLYKPGSELSMPKTRDLRVPYFILHNPDVIMITADSLISLLNSKLLKPNQVSTIQIDEASQLPEHTLIRLLTQFPNANYGLIGDIQQLPPYCETGLDGKLKDYGIGNTMERAVKENLFPQAMLREVYRCHPKVTNLLSGLFYNGKLISGITEEDRSDFMLGRPDFWPTSRYPVLVVNNEERGNRMGTSCGNKAEVQIVKDLLKVLTQRHNGYQLQPSNIGVISFYAAQTSVLTEALRGQKVKCGTVDAFQGTERDVIILCCTNEKISEFMQLSNRINVSMSRAKQVTIIVGNVEGLKKAKYWGTIVRKADTYRCVIEPKSLQTVNPNPKSNPNKKRRRTKKRTSKKDKTTEYQLVDAMKKLHIASRKGAKKN